MAVRMVDMRASTMVGGKDKSTVAMLVPSKVEMKVAWMARLRVGSSAQRKACELAALKVAEMDLQKVLTTVVVSVAYWAGRMVAR